MLVGAGDRFVDAGEGQAGLIVRHASLGYDGQSCHHMALRPWSFESSSAA